MGAVRGVPVRGPKREYVLRINKQHVDGHYRYWWMLTDWRGERLMTSFQDYGSTVTLLRTAKRLIAVPFRVEK